MIWLQFIVSSVLIVFSGVRLTVYADILGDRLNIGKVWVGVILLGLVTSLPEAVASLTAVIGLNANDLAVGNMVGSNSFNLVLIVIMDMVYRQGSVTNQVQFNRSHLLSAGFAVLLTCTVLVEMVLSGQRMLPMVGPVGLGSIFIFVIYFFGVRVLARVGKQDHLHFGGGGGEESLSRIYRNLFLCSLLVVAGAMWLANVTEAIAEMTGLGQTFVGTLFLAFVTSLPEMVVTVSALKLGVFDLAIGNIFGSNMINMFLIAVCDIFFLKGPLLASVSKIHIVTAFLSIFLTGIVLVGIKQTKKRTFAGLGWDSILLVLFFVAGMDLVYKLR